MTKHYANPDETVFVGSLFTFHFGAYGDTEVCVYQRPDHLDDALETAADWLKDNAPGLFTEPDYNGAREERACECAGTDTVCDDCAAHAEVDLNYTESGWLASWEWSVGEEECDGPPDATFDRFDIAQAYAAYWNVWHQGQGSHGYRRLCAALDVLGNTASDLQFDRLGENAQAIYRRLVLANGR